MPANVLFASNAFERMDPSCTLPEKFKRLLDQFIPEDAVNGRLTAVKMHLGRRIGYTTIHPIFVKILVDKLKERGAKVFVTDQIVGDARDRGYTESYLGCPIVDACGLTGKYVYEKTVDYKTFKNVGVAGHIHDAEVLFDLSHIKGHGSCGFGGAVKNIAMGCVNHRTRSQIHALEGGLNWNKDKCILCKDCVTSCNHHANSFTDEDILDINFHHCTFCQHCVKVCPTGAITLDDTRYDDFQMGMALATQKCLETFDPKNIYYINVLLNITMLCDCWGLTTPNIVPDIGIVASQDIVAVEQACLDLIKNEDFIPAGVPVGYELKDEGHLLYRIHGRDPFVQLDALQQIGMGDRGYALTDIV